MSVFELLLIMIVSLLVMKPEDIPKILAKIKEIKSFITNKYHQDILYLKEFQFNGICISEFMEEKWRDAVVENCISIIIGEKGASVLTSYFQNAFDGFKCEIYDKLF